MGVLDPVGDATLSCDVLVITWWVELNFCHRGSRREVLSLTNYGLRGVVIGRGLLQALLSAV